MSQPYRLMAEAAESGVGGIFLQVTVATETTLVGAREPVCVSIPAWFRLPMTEPTASRKVLMAKP